MFNVREASLAQAPSPEGHHSVEISQVDVFTQTALQGNPLAVVMDAQGLSDRTMQAIAREMNLSETAFVYAARGEEVPVRFFTPSKEVPVCGHGTLGSQFIRARAMGQESGRIRQRSPGGVWSVRWDFREADGFLVMSQGPVKLEQRWEGSALEALLSALGLAVGDLIDGWPVETITTGHAKAVVPVRNPGILGRLTPDQASLEEVSQQTETGGFFLFSLDETAGEVRARMFAPALGIPEDPVNGSGHGPLGAYLFERGGEVRDWSRAGFWSTMGDHLGRPGRVWVRLVDSTQVDVGGFVAPVFETAMTIATT